MVEKFKNYIGGEWVEPASDRYVENRNPADKTDLIGLWPESDHRDVEAAVEAAERAFATWRLVPAPKRGEILYRAGQILMERKEECARAMTREMGKVLNETRGDVQEAIDTAFFAAGEGRRLAGETVPVELPNKFGMSIRTPVGVCGMITPWNFPMAIPSWKIFPALICGNTVVIKPSELTPHSVHNFLQALLDAGLPPGVVNVVYGRGREVGQPLAEHPKVRLISFTGSSEVGKILGEVCGKNLKKLSLELGGKNAQIVMDDADIDLAVEGALWGAFGTTGQRCTATSRVILHEKIVAKFTENFLARAKALRLGNGLEDGVQVGPLVSQEQQKTVDNYVRIGIDEGATVILGGEIERSAACAKGFFYQPTVFTNVHPSMRIAQEEIFGPVVCLIRVRNFEEAIEVLNGTKYGLSSSVYTKDVNRAFQAIRDIEAGITYVNGPTIGAEVQLPFGGVKETGNGHREAGKTVLDIFTEWKSVYVDYSGKLQRAQIDMADTDRVTTTVAPAASKHLPKAAKAKGKKK